MKIKDLFLAWIGHRRSTRSSENQNPDDPSTNYVRDSAGNRSFQTPRDVKKKRRLRKLRTDGRRQSAPPEVDRRLATNCQLAQTATSSGGKYKDQQLVTSVTSPQNVSPEAPPGGGKENLILDNFSADPKRFSERPIDCEGLDGLNNGNLENRGLGRMRAKSEAAQKPIKKRRPLSLGNLYSLIKPKNNSTGYHFEPPPPGQETTFVPVWNNNDLNRQLANNHNNCEFAYQTNEQSENRKIMPRQMSESVAEADRFLQNLKYENNSTPITPRSGQNDETYAVPNKLKDLSKNSDNSEKYDRKSDEILGNSENLKKIPDQIDKIQQNSKNSAAIPHKNRRNSKRSEFVKKSAKIDGKPCSGSENSDILATKYSGKLEEKQRNSKNSKNFPSPFKLQEKKLVAIDSREEFRKLFAQGLWSVEPKEENEKQKAAEISTNRHRSGTVPEPEPLIHSKIHKRYKSCDILSDTKDKSIIDREMFNQYFNNTVSSEESGVVSSGVCSSLSSERERTNHHENDSKLLEHTTTILREEFTISNSFTDSALLSRDRACSQPPSDRVTGSSNADWFLDLEPFHNVKEPNEKQREGPDTGRYQVVVAIDFGTAYSGYAYAFKNDVNNGKENVFTMRRAEGGDPGLTNQKCPTCLLLTPDGKFHSFGYGARDFYHDLEPSQARKYLFFDQFKMILHNQDLSQETLIQASNGHFWPAIEVFAHSLKFFKRRSVLELSDRLGSSIDNQSIQWVVTVPTIWTQDGKQLMREAAYQASIASSFKPDQLLIALEPEAAGLFCRELKLHEVAPDLNRQFMSLPPSLRSEFQDQVTQGTLKAVHLKAGDSYIVLDCGGGTTDITAHKVAPDGASLIELAKARGGAFGSNSVDRSFEALLKEIFTESFINEFHATYPAAWIDLVVAFESRKRSTHPYKLNPLNVALPFSFMDLHKKKTGCKVEQTVRKAKNENVTWNSQGMLRLTPDAIRRLFQPTLVAITDCVNRVFLDVSRVSQAPIKYLFLVGGFAESPMVQNEIKKHFSTKTQIIIPQEQSVAVLKGAVLYGLHPNQISVRRSKLTYGIGVLNQFDPILHPPSKRIIKNGNEWCTDVFDIFVNAGEPLSCGDVIKRRYCPASVNQKEIVIQIYSSENPHPIFVTEKGVRKCAMLRLALPRRKEKDNGFTDEKTGHNALLQKREIEASMRFGDTEIAVTAVEKESRSKIRCEIDFLGR